MPRDALERSCTIRTGITVARRGRRAIRLHRDALKPCCIPMRICANRCHQSGPYRIGNDVSRDLENILVPAQGSVVITCLPHRLPLCPGLLKRIAGLAFEALHQCSKRHFFQLNQPMHMVWHYDPGQRSAVVLFFRVTKVLDDQPCEAEVVKQRLTSMSDRSQHIKPAWYRASRAAKPVAMRVRHCVHP